MTYFALYDLLDCAAAAVNEAESGRPALAWAAWRAARDSAVGLFPPGSAEDAAAGVILAVSLPETGTEVPARLWRALDSASYVVLHAKAGDIAKTEALLPAACAAAGVLERDAREALMVILREARWMAVAGSGAIA